MTCESSRETRVANYSFDRCWKRDFFFPPGTLTGNAEEVLRAFNEGRADGIIVTLRPLTDEAGELGPETVEEEEDDWPREAPLAASIHSSRSKALLTSNECMVPFASIMAKGNLPVSGLVTPDCTVESTKENDLVSDGGVAAPTGDAGLLVALGVATAAAALGDLTPLLEKRKEKRRGT